MPSPRLGEIEFTDLVNALVREAPPRLFAIVEEHGDREDGWILAWGMALEDRAVLVRTGGRAVHSHQSAESALRFFSRLTKVRLVWCEPHTRDM